MAASTWQDWALGVLAGITAPKSPTNLATLRGWSTREKGYWPSIQWNNPLNTTEPWPGAYDSGAQPGAHDVKVYPTLQAGCDATVTTLIVEPYYPAIVAALRASLPARFWGADARAQLDTWGTGSGWLDSVPAQEDEMLDPKDPIVIELRNRIDAIFEGAPSAKWQSYLNAKFAALPAAPPDPTLGTKLDALTVAVKALTDKLGTLTLKAT